MNEQHCQPTRPAPRRRWGSARTPSLRHRPTALALPWLVATALLVGVPLIGSVWLAFTDYYGFGAPSFTGLDNWRRLATDETFWHSLANSAKIAAIAIPLRTALAVGCALLLHRRSSVNSAARTAVFLPSIIPDAAWALLWLWLLNPLYGPLPLTLEAFGLPSPGWFTDPTAARGGLALVASLQMGEGFLVALAARRLLPDSLHEAAAMEGAGRTFTFRRITLPLMAPILILLALRDVVLLLHTTFIPALLITAGEPHSATLVAPLYVYRRAFLYGELGYASTLSIMLLITAAAVAAVQLIVLHRTRLLELL